MTWTPIRTILRTIRSTTVFREPEGRSRSSPSQAASDNNLKASPYFIFTQIGTHWRGHGSLKNLFVFSGDSYSSRLSQLRWTYEAANVDYNTVDEDTLWIDFFAASVSSHSAVDLNNFGFRGATAEYDLTGQLARFFERFSKERRFFKGIRFSKGTEPENATYVFFLGINDCGIVKEGQDLASLVDVLFNAIRRLYVDATARNFILVDVPPTNRSPRGINSTHLAPRIEEWNDTLLSHARDFVSKNPEATVLVFSSSRVLSEVLDDPCAYGFYEDANVTVGRGIWRDGLHLSSAVHKIVANRLSSALGF